MLLQLSIGSIIIAITVFIEVVFILTAVRFLKYRRSGNIQGSEFFTLAATLTAITLWLVAAFSLACWVWALAFMALGCFDHLEQALYFSMVAFTSLGFGDLTLPTQWRILSGPIAANGLILFGLNIAVLIEFMHRLLKTNNEK